MHATARHNLTPFANFLAGRRGRLRVTPFHFVCRFRKCFPRRDEKIKANYRGVAQTHVRRAAESDKLAFRETSAADSLYIYLLKNLPVFL